MADFDFQYCSYDTLPIKAIESHQTAIFSCIEKFEAGHREYTHIYVVLHSRRLQPALKYLKQQISTETVQIKSNISQLFDYCEEKHTHCAQLTSIAESSRFKEIEVIGFDQQQGTVRVSQIESLSDSLEQLTSENSIEAKSQPSPDALLVCEVITQNYVSKTIETEKIFLGQKDNDRIFVNQISFFNVELRNRFSSTTYLYEQQEAYSYAYPHYGAKQKVRINLDENDQENKIRRHSKQQEKVAETVTSDFTLKIIIKPSATIVAPSPTLAGKKSRIVPDFPGFQNIRLRFKYHPGLLGSFCNIHPGSAIFSLVLSSSTSNADMEFDNFLRNIGKIGPSQSTYMPGEMDYIHVIYGDTDSLYLAIGHESWSIKDKKLWDQLQFQLFPSAHDDNYYDKNKILGRNIESEVTTCLALVPNIEHFKKLHGKSPDNIQDIPPDFQIKPLSKLNRPYFSPKLGSWEIDLVFSMDERIIRANQ
ncbi:MAG: hypothetical protein EZS28_019663, partial [Streblomastix strix]